MERLTPELGHLILSQLESIDSDNFRIFSVAGRDHVLPRLASYSTTSRRWQCLIESRTFRHLCLTSADLISGKAERLISPRRLGLVRTVRVCIDLEPEDLAAAGRPEDEDLSIAGGHVLTAAVKALFRLLEPIQPRSEGSNIAIRLEVRPPYVKDPRWGRGGKNHREPATVEDRRVREGDLPLIYLPIDREEGLQLPALPAVSALEVIMRSYSRIFTPGSICHIAASMPLLRVLDMHFGGLRGVPQEFRVQLREGLSQGLDRVSKSVRSFKLEFISGLSGQDWRSDDCVLPADAEGGDSLSKALCRFSQRSGLVNFNVKARLDNSILEPPPGSTETSSWTNLQNYTLTLPGITPSGCRFFGKITSLFGSRDLADAESGFMDTREDDSLYDDPHQNPLDYTMMEPLWVASGKAAARMPSLKCFNIHVAERFDFQDFHLKYRAGQGMKLIMPRPFCHPGETCLQPWREAAEKHGARLRVSLQEPLDRLEKHVIY